MGSHCTSMLSQLFVSLKQRFVRKNKHWDIERSACFRGCTDLIRSKGLTRSLSLNDPTHHVHTFSVKVDVIARLWPTVSSSSNARRRSSYEPGRPCEGERRLSTTPIDARTSFCASLKRLPCSCARSCCAEASCTHSEVDAVVWAGSKADRPYHCKLQCQL